MPTEITVAIIGLAGSCLGSVIGVMASARLTQYRLEQLEKKVDKHNSVIERTYALERRDAVKDEELKDMDRRLKGLERSACA